MPMSGCSGVHLSRPLWLVLYPTFCLVNMPNLMMKDFDRSIAWRSALVLGPHLSPGCGWISRRTVFKKPKTFIGSLVAEYAVTRGVVMWRWSTVMPQLTLPALDLVRLTTTETVTASQPNDSRIYDLLDARQWWGIYLKLLCLTRLQLSERKVLDYWTTLYEQEARRALFINHAQHRHRYSILRHLMIYREWECQLTCGSNLSQPYIATVPLQMAQVAPANPPPPPRLIHIAFSYILLLIPDLLVNRDLRCTNKEPWPWYNVG